MQLAINYNNTMRFLYVKRWMHWSKVWDAVLWSVECSGVKCGMQWC